MTDKNKFAFAGGDGRAKYAALYLSSRGFEIARDVCDAAYVVFPLSQRTGIIKAAEGETTVEDVVKKAPPDAVFFGGPAIRRLVGEAGEGRVYDVTENEKFAMKNAALTAEGAIGIAVGKTPFSIDGMRAAVLGFGRIGRALAEKLCALGACVTVCARRRESVAEASALCRATLFCDFDPSGADCIFNTVPARALGEDQLRLIGDDTYIVELASPPGGFDEAFRARHGERFTDAQGLPGKTAPASAGAAMAEAVLDILKEKK